MARPVRQAGLVRGVAFSSLRHPGAGRSRARLCPRVRRGLALRRRPSRNADVPQRRHAQSFFDFIQLADPSNVEWQRHFAAAYGRAADSIGFDGFHIDTYGYPREATNRQGQSIDMPAAYRSFLSYFRSERPHDLVSFNQVNGVPSALELARAPLSLLRGMASQQRLAPPGGPHGPQRRRAGHPGGASRGQRRTRDHRLLPAGLGRRGPPRRPSYGRYYRGGRHLLGGERPPFGDRTAAFRDPYYPSTKGSQATRPPP